MTEGLRTSCNPKVLQEFLGNQLTPEEESHLEAHLDRCKDCCQTLGEMAANDDQWSAVRDHLGIVDDSTEKHNTQSLSFLNASDDPQMLGRFGGYEIAGVIGSGGMGIVLKGFDRALNRYVAIKVLLPHYASSISARQRFAREARAAAAVIHENVVEIYGVSAADDDELPYFVMPYIRGESLEKRLERCGTLSVSETLRISIQIASGLAAAHEQGLVHRDIKPANILLLDDVERVKITDFGLARAADDASLTRSGVIAGTPQYMSPEQADGGHVTTQSDLFSLGSVMYQMCTGRRPFRAETPLGIIRRIIDEDPRAIQETNPEIPEWFCQIIEKLHAKQPEQRILSANLLAKILKQCLAHVHQPHNTELPEEVQSLFKPQQPKSTRFTDKQIFTGVLMFISLLFLASFGLSSSNLWTSNPSESETNVAGQLLEDHQTYKKRFTASFADASSIGTLTVEIKRGEIQVEAHDQSNVVVDLEVPGYHSAAGDSEGLKELRPSGLDFRVTSKDNAIKVDSNSERFITNLRIKVPRDVNLKLDSYRDGKLSVKQVNGKLITRSFHNNITLLECSGSADVYSYHGDLVASFRSSNNDQPLNFESYNGSIEVMLPPNASLNTHIRTGHGKLLTDFDIQETADQWQEKTRADGSVDVESTKFVHGTINGGGEKNLFIETEHGDIRIQQQKPSGLGN